MERDNNDSSKKEKFNWLENETHDFIQWNNDLHRINSAVNVNSVIQPNQQKPPPLWQWKINFIVYLLTRLKN